MFTLLPRAATRCQYVCASCLRSAPAQHAQLRHNSSAAVNSTPKASLPETEVVGEKKVEQEESVGPEDAGKKKQSRRVASTAKKSFRKISKDTAAKSAAAAKKPKGEVVEDKEASITAEAEVEPEAGSKPATEKTKKQSTKVKTDTKSTTDETSDPSKAEAEAEANLAKPKRRGRPALRFREIPQKNAPKSKSPAAVRKIVSKTAPETPRKTAPEIPRKSASSTKVRPPNAGPLLTKLQSITSASASQQVQQLLKRLAKEGDIFNEHGKQLAESGDGLFKDKTPEEAGTSPQLNSRLLKTYQTLEEALKVNQAPAAASELPKTKDEKGAELGTIQSKGLDLKAIDVPQPPVPGLICGLERVLFNPGVYHLRDPHSRVYNFNPYLENITPVKEFDYDALKEYITSSRDAALINIAAKERTKYTGSTSSMTSTLAHFHYLLSKWRPLNLDYLSRGFPSPLHTFTRMQRAPAGIFLRWRDGVYAIDANKEFDTSNVLMWLGKSMEKFLTLEKPAYEKYQKQHSHRLTDEERNEPESYHYTTMGNFLMRSQLDAHDPRLPGTGMYDLKTRAVVSIRTDATEFEQGMGYEIKNMYGEWDSFEREYYDLCRSAFMKYSLQARMGRMDGIFVAFHNIERIFGFQYLPIGTMDEAVHGTNDTTLGDTEFKLSVKLMDTILDRATEKFPEQSLQMDFETRAAAQKGDSYMYVFVTPTTDDKIKTIQERNLAQIQEYERKVIGLKSREQQELMRAVAENSAKEAQQEDEAERLEAALENPFSFENAEIIRTAAAKIKSGETVTEKAMEVMLDSVVARLDEGSVEPDSGNESAGAARPKEEAEAPPSEAETAKPAADSGATVDGIAEETISSKPEAEKEPPVLAFRVTVRNFVNGQEVLRPEALTKRDTWDVKWSIKEMEGETARSNYQMAKNRKMKMQMRDNSVDAWFNNAYNKQITKQVQRGKKHRKEINRLDEKYGIQVLDDVEFVDYEALEGKPEVKHELAEAVREVQDAQEEGAEGREEAVREDVKEEKPAQEAEMVRAPLLEDKKGEVTDEVQGAPEEDSDADAKQEEAKQEEAKQEVKQEEVKEEMKSEPKEKPWWFI